MTRSSAPDNVHALFLRPQQTRQYMRFARNSPSSFQVLPSGSSASPVQWNECGGNFRKQPANRRAVGVRANLHDIFSIPAANSSIAAIRHRIEPVTFQA